ncbi:hypothetical protein TREMEDRAFT_65836 [Tremella mesenterica DSM 1558]|uniref:uncharacterized protein n=1 Tax=Tremella mesenterica (strain ATCC 24925 / CBS 8224 / DSM 1558 / NBRC 9311 / NRRL Y-6157 / RJB 2259-6 / UBC 559-6) TaxID=578456 RepID=UPI00032BE5B2|nr:uncharacterized protein TREMEDRAFT_65836 [Tremella mesenterica DSM 1558]EIW66225.1 hypothetical protein TREMEDRAFT_65836 [Tremella mesenterica DSM 1558]
MDNTAFLMAHPAFGFGTYWVGFLVDAVLLGVILQLCATWAITSGKESPIIKILVWYLVILSLAITIFISAFAYHLFIFNFGNYSAFSDANDAGMGSTSSAIAAKVLAPDPSKLYTVEYLVLGWIICEALNDVLTTSVIAFYLIRSRSEWSETNQIITKLLLLVVETQLPPTMMALVFLVFYIAAPNTTLIAFFVCTPKVYVTCLLFVLNAKVKLQREISYVQGRLGTSNAAQYNRSSVIQISNRSSSRTPQRLSGIQVTTQTITRLSDKSPHSPSQTSIPPPWAVNNQTSHEVNTMKLRTNEYLTNLTLTISDNIIRSPLKTLLLSFRVQASRSNVLIKPQAINHYAVHHFISVPVPVTVGSRDPSERYGGWRDRQKIRATSKGHGCGTMTHRRIAPH